MQKNRIQLFFGREGITQILRRIDLIVFFMLITMSSVLAKSVSEYPELNSAPAELQQGKVTGKVVDLKGDPIPGATVMIKGTVIGVLTDVSGNYSLSNVPKDATLSISFVGMTSQEIPIRGQTRIDVVLREATLAMEEVVVIGYGTQKKESVVGAITQTTSAQLQRTGNVTDLSQALTGQLPGVVTITSTGEPGGDINGNNATTVFIRGQNTWNGGQPLILVDGAERGMNNIDVNEVETISVLKDASATAVFGVKGANGVILITTKRGQLGKTKLSFTYNTTAKMVSKLPTVMDSYSAQLIRNESIERETPINETSWADYIPQEIVNKFKLPQTAENAAIYPNVDWENAMFKDVGMSHRATLNAQGGTNFVTYFGSLAYLHEGDMFKDYDNGHGYSPSFGFDRFNFRSNLDFKLTKSTVLKVNLSGYYSKKNSANDWDANIWRGVYCLPPDAHLVKYPDGRWGYSPLTQNWPNPIELVYTSGIREQRTTELDSDFALEQDLGSIVKGLKAKASLFYDNSILSTGGITEPGTNREEKYIDWNLYTGSGQNPNEYTTIRPTTGLNLFDFIVQPWSITQEAVTTSKIKRRMLYQFQLEYARRFGNHNVGAMGLVKREEYATGSEFKHYREDWVFRTTYDYDTKYLFEMNGAYNGSEQFGPGYRFDFFPSVAVGWTISNEKFWKIDWINRLKLRYSIGMVGDDKLGDNRWLYATQYSYGGNALINQFGTYTSPYTWYKESSVGNPNIHWEKAKKNNFGVEMGIFNNLFSVTYDYFTEDRTDILLAGGSRAIPPFYGATAPSANLGRVKSNGHELEIKFDKTLNKNWHLWSTFSVSHVENKILTKDDPILMANYLKAAGYPVNQTKSQLRTDRYTNWDEIYASVPLEASDNVKLPGYWNLLDFDGDGVVTAAGDNVPYGYSEVPQNTGNFSIGVDYKGFSAMVQFYGVTNVSHRVGLYLLEDAKDLVFDVVSDYWSKDNPNGADFIPRWKTAGESVGEYFTYDASYLRLKTAEIAYTFNSKWVKKIGLSSLKLYVNGNNLAFWSKLPDDREAAWAGGSPSAGAYPTVKRVNLGIDLTF